MNTLARPAVNPAGPQAATPYFLRRVRFQQAVDAEAARRGLGPDPLAA